MEKADILIPRRLESKSEIQIEFQSQKVKKEKKKKGKFGGKNKTISNGNRKGTQTQLAQLLQGGCFERPRVSNVHMGQASLKS